ncbi:MULTISPECIES: IclR family transcriptional regulator [Chelativorans]|jgi:DNA-binding IclR family transcriptional regulator|uniref:Transcriptional regulator, IclR family n=1 Tax=Chelativorans sp. (strain BNC1) TaxID=266779 RepID=Q11LB3_CHESB|nr:MULTISPECIES: IclR family transcriptional regulator [Chelativorans]
MDVTTDAGPAEFQAAPVRSLSKGLAALDILRGEGELRTTDLAARLSIDKGVASRILQTLAQTGYAERMPGRRYRIGPKLAAQEHAVLSVGIRASARPLLARLSEQVQEAVYLGVLVDGQVLYLDKEVPASELKVDRPIPTLAPLYCTAIGKLFVAMHGISVPRELPAYTPRTIADPALYATEIAAIAERGYAWDDEEFHLGVRCVAAPLRDRGGKVLGALSVAAPSVRLASEDIEAAARITKNVADAFTAP